MSKFILSASLILASLVGVSSAMGPAEPVQPSHTATLAAGRVQYFGPWTQAVAQAKCNKWSETHTCAVVQNPRGYKRGWYVEVYFQN